MPKSSSRFARGTGAAAALRPSRAKSRISRIARLAVPVAAVAGLLAFQSAGVTVAAAGRPAGHAGGHGAVAVPDLSRPINIAREFPSPLSTTDCQAEIGISCYTPVQYYRAYDLSPLYRSGITGAGRTIVIVDSFGSPTVASDVKIFDAQFGLPDPNLKIEKFGNVPPFDPTNSTMVSWAFETTLDVEYAHAIAPGAKIVLAETPVAEVEGTSGFPQMMNAERSLINRGVGDVITQSFGATENTFSGFDGPNTRSLLNLRYAFTDALLHHVTVLASSGDDGVTNAESDGSTLYPFAVNSWPSSDPLVTSVGGSQLSLDNNGSPAVTRHGLERRLRRGRRRLLAGVRPAAVPDRRPPRGRQSARHAGHRDECRGEWRRLDLRFLLRSRWVRLGIWSAVPLRHRRSSLASWPWLTSRPVTGPGLAQPGAVRPGRAEPAHRPPDRDRGHHHRQ